MESHQLGTDYPLRQLCSRDIQIQLFYEVVPFLVASSMACTAVVIMTTIAEHSPSHLFPLLSLLGILFHSIVSHFYTSNSSVGVNPYGGFLVVIWIWLFWSTTSCFERGFFQLSTTNIVFRGLTESDIALAVCCIFSELFLLSSPEVSVQTVLPLVVSAFFSIAPIPSSEDSELLRIEVFLVFATRYFIVYQVRRFFLKGESSFLNDYIVALSGFWILLSRNFLAILLGVAVSLTCLLFATTFFDTPDKKKD